jgi:hypothetical protein
MDDNKTTTDHEEIIHWVEEHDGRPVVIKDPGNGRPKAVSIFFPDHDEYEPVEEISWSEFFKKFDENDLEFAYKDSDDSSYFKIIEH